MTGWPLAVAATDAPAPTFYVAAALYALAALLYLGSLFEGRERIARLARWVLLAAFLSHGGDISWRAMHKLHPGSSVREALGFLAWVLAGGYLLATLRYKLAVVGGLVAPVALGLLLAARLSPAPGAVEDLPTLGRIHIALATLGVALFALATALSAVYLIQERGLKEKKFGGVMFRRGTALETLDMLAHRVVLVGFPIFTIALMLGAVWVARRADGYDRPEYPLALVAWVAFGGLLVARSARGVRGRKAAFLTIVGFAASALVLAIYLGRHALG